MSSTILIVDDEPGGRYTLESILEEQGYVIEMAENGVEALEKAHQLLPDVILLDVMMPGMDGFEVCQRISTRPRLRDQQPGHHAVARRARARKDPRRSGHHDLRRHGLPRRHFPRQRRRLPPQVGG